MFSKFKCKHCYVVKLRRITGKLIHCIINAMNQLFRPCFAVLIQRFDQSFFPKHGVIGIIRFRHTVGINKNTVTGIEFKLSIPVLCFFQDTNEHIMIIIKKLKASAGAPQSGAFMSGVACHALACRYLQYCQPYRDKHHGGIPLAKLKIHLFQCSGRIAASHQLVPNQSLGHHHEQRGRDSLPGNIRDHQCQMIIVDQEEIIEIPAHFFGRRHGSEQLKLRPVRERRENLRQRVCLDLPGHAQLLFDPFLFFYSVLLFDLLPFHPADRVHLLIQGKAGLIDLQLHSVKFPDGEGFKFNGFQISLPDTDDPILQRIELAHELFQPQLVDQQGDQEYNTGKTTYMDAGTANHLLIVLHGNLTDQCPLGVCHCHGECT